MRSVGSESRCVMEHGGWVNGRMKGSVLEARVTTWPCGLGTAP